MHELKSSLLHFQERITTAYETINPSELKLKIEELQEKASEPNFWNNSQKAAEISQDLNDLIKAKETWEILEKETQEQLDLCDIIDAEKEPEERENIRKKVEDLEKRLKKAEIKLFLSGKYDHNNAIVSIHVGTGGTDAQDWAEMLLRMYLRYAEKQEFKTEMLEKSEGEEAGIKSATFKVTGPYVYGYLKEEAGVHRLVRISPFNVGRTRETSFALVEVIPEIKEEQEFEIQEKDLRIDVYASSGPGGQSVNTSNSAVRITHLPTNLVAACQNERSQLQNKEQALKVLKGKLIKLQEKLRLKTVEELKGKFQEASWGNQIRSYVLHPYQMVKDHRTDFETSQAEKVLDGEILDEFIEASLEKRAKEIDK